MATYTFTDQGGQERVIEGDAAFKAYLLDGGLAFLQSKTGGAAKYRYGLTNRPLSIGTAPKGWVATEAAPAEHADVARHGIVSYDRPLTPEEVSQFELSPIIDGDEARNGVAASFVSSLGEYAKSYAEMAREGADSDVADMLSPNFRKWAIKNYGGPVSVGSWPEMSGRIIGALLLQNGGSAAPESDPQKDADRALFQSVIDGTAQNILAPELADELEVAYLRNQEDPEAAALFEQAVIAYQAAMMAATSSLA